MPVESAGATGTARNTAPVLQPTSLLSFSSAATPHRVVRGRITAVRAYSAHTRLAQVTLTSVGAPDPPGTRIELELKGLFADRASRRFHRGDILILPTDGIVTVCSKVKGKERDKGGVPRVRLAGGLTGWLVRKNGDEELVQYKEPGTRGGTGPLAAVAKPPPPRSHSLAPPEAPAATLDGPPPSCGFEIPMKVAPEKKVSPPGEGSRSRKRRKVAVTALARLDAPPSMGYTELNALGTIVGSTDRSALQSLKLDIVAVVADKGKVFEPRVEGRDWYCTFLVVDPTRLNDPVEVQWYAKAVSGLPEPQIGDVFVAHSLALKSTSSPSVPILLAKSFVVVPHALLKPPALHADPPDQDPPPPPGAAPPKTSAELLILRLTADELVYAAQMAKATRAALTGAAAATGSAGLRLEGAAVRHGAFAVGAVGGAAQRVSGRGAAGGRPLLRVEEIVEGQFCELIGMVTKVHCSFPYDSVPSSSAASLYITDYTSHPSLYSYDTGTAVGLPGQLILQISAFGSQAAPLAALLDPRTREAKRGALVHLRNVRIKAGTGGTLEGTLWEERDERYRGRKDVTVVDLRKKDQEERWGARAREVQNRHREYWAARSKA